MVLVNVSDAAFLVTFYKVTLMASAVSSTNLGSILIFAKMRCWYSCSILLYVGDCFHLFGRGSVIYILIFVHAAMQHFYIFCFSPL